MCMQCMMSAMGAGAAASGTRSFVAARHFAWLTPGRMRRLSGGLVAGALLASTLLVSGSTPRAPAGPQPSAKATAAPTR
jgi:hypothetical protein